MENVVVFLSSHKSSRMGGVEWTFIALCTTMVLCFVDVALHFHDMEAIEMAKIAIDTNSAEVFAIWR